MLSCDVYMYLFNFIPHAFHHHNFNCLFFSLRIQRCQFYSFWRHSTINSICFWARFCIVFFFFLVSSEIKNIWADFSTEFHKKTMKNKILLRNLFVFIIVVYLIHFPLKSINWLTNMCYWNSESSKYKKRKPKKSTKKM